MIHPKKCGIRAELIDVPAVKRHLTETGWTQIKTKRKDISVFQYTKSGRFEQVTIPNDRSLSDYCTALCQAIETIADFEDVPTEHLLQKLMCENIRQRFPEINAELPDEPAEESPGEEQASRQSRLIWKILKRRNRAIADWCYISRRSFTRILRQRPGNTV